MSQLNQNRYDALLRRVGDLKGPGSKVNDALTELFPMIDVENLPAELLLLSGSKLCMATAALGAGGVGFFTNMILSNPVGSGVIARLMSIEIIISAQTINFSPTANVSAALGGEAFADTRIIAEGTALKLQGASNLLTAHPARFQKRSLVDLTLTWEPPVAIAVLSPGAGFGFGPNLDNQSMTASLTWIERQAQPSELNL